MNHNLKKFTKNFSYTFFANILSMTISTILILLVPKFISVKDYGYWQLYIFYSSYISYMSLGLTDGVYLRFGGYNYNDLKKNVLRSQYWFLILFNIVVNFSISILYYLNSNDLNKSIVVIFTCIVGVLTVPRSLITFILQATNRIKEFSIIIILERSIYFILVIVFLILKINKFEYLILADLLGKICSIIYSVIVCKDLVWGELEEFKNSLSEIYINISVGYKLLLANLASMLIIGIVRLCIEKNWTIDTFGKVSLTLSICNMLMIFINSIGIILFPTLRRVDKEKLIVIYSKIRNVLMIVLIGILIAYYPLKEILGRILPKYEESLKYMALLFPMCIYESKMLLLINTYFKVLRKEKLMMKLNIIAIVISFLLTFTSSFIFKNLDMTILNIVIILALRCIIAEISLSKIININVKKDITLELTMSIFFIVLSWYLNSFLAMILYTAIYIIYLLIKRKDILESISFYKIVLKK
ncbi:lipopolysaccharide biosynthesis protein, partial [Clostridium perfringens]|uniref:lipopolysaccharide biosynthesis protein n=1 Tax=Clostridium perfringens TaxID=1502 RepID=UPI0018E46B25